MLTYSDLVKIYTNAGIKKGDVLCIQSSYKGLNGLEDGPNTLIQALIDVLGDEGTLLMPTYNFKSWTENHYFDIRETSSGVGIISETFRKMKGVKRTKHPIHSLCVWGKRSEEICAIDEQNSFGENSVFSYLLKINAIYSTAGLGLEMPFLPCHLAEKETNAPYRRTKLFSGIYLGYDKIPELKTYSLDVKTDYFMNSKAPIYDTHKMQYNLGAFKKIEYNGIQFWLGTAKDYHASLLKLIAENKEIFGW